mmetsp:Transcript_7429/g.17810  ORF Transcript_7429/g.17810 Transcript_7429/m.17810 type:complete len:666 (-) Transcript_7429:40-2037(-)
MSQARAQAQDAVGLYFSQLDPYSPNDENMKNFLKGPLLAITLSCFNAAPELSLNVKEEIEEEKKNSSSWRDYLPNGPSENPTTGDDNSMAESYKSLPRRARARMEAFLAGCMLAVPCTLLKHSNSREEKDDPSVVSLGDGLSGFHIPKSSSKDSIESAKQRPSIIERVIAVNGKRNLMPQISEQELVIRLDLYIRTLQRVRNLKEQCVIAMENPKIIKLRARYITNAFVTTAGCVRSMNFTLTKLLSCLTMEVLAVDSLSEDIVKVIRRIVLEYEHGTSFASLAFLSSPEGNAESLLTPLVLKYIRYLQTNFENVVEGCELERMMATALDPRMRRLFKTIEFKSIGHLLEVCHEQKHKLQSIELAPHVCALAENVNELVDNTMMLKQALRDLQREVITVNGHVLPPVTSRKDLLQLLTQTLNSRSLTAAPPKTKHGSPKKSRRKVAIRRQSFHSDESDCVISSSEFESSAAETSADDIVPPSPNAQRVKERKYRRRQSRFHISTIDLLTRRLLIAASRTGNGGDAYFVVRDLFGGEDVEVVPTNTLPMQGRMVRPGTIDILVRLASVTIKCHQSFDVYPKALVGDCEPLIQFHSTTTETIYLREVRSSDSNEESNPTDDISSDDADGNSKRLVVVQEKKTDKTGWRNISIRPALYEKVEVWNTPS